MIDECEDNEEEFNEWALEKYKQTREKDMQQNKYQELKDNMEALKDFTETTSNKVMTQHRMLQAMNTLLQNFDSRFDIFKKYAEKNNWFTPGEFEEEMDSMAGMMRKADTEKVEIGDVVWVNYTAKNPKSEVTEKDFPLRIGSKTIVFEDSLPGKAIGETFTCTHDVDKNPVEFKITIIKAKRKINPETTEVMNGAVASKGQDTSTINH
jgi:hypothetical protein